MMRSFVLACLITAIVAYDDVMFNMTVSNETSDDLHITCDTMSFTMPGVNTLFFNDMMSSNVTNFTVHGSDTGFNISSLDDGSNTDKNPDLYDYSKLDDGSDSGNDSAVFDYSKLDMEPDVDTPEVNTTELPFNTSLANFTFADFLFNDDPTERMKDMGFPFDLSCQLVESGNFIDVGVQPSDNSTQIVEILTQVRVASAVAGLFLPPHMSQDYQVACSGQAVSHIHSDPKESLVARWYNVEQFDIVNETSAVCLFSILDTNGNFWKMVQVPASAENTTINNTIPGESEMKEVMTPESAAEEPTTTDVIITTATDQETPAVPEETTTITEGPADTAETEVTGTTNTEGSVDAAEIEVTGTTTVAVVTEAETTTEMMTANIEGTGDKEVEADEGDKIDFEIKDKEDAGDDMGDLGEIAVDGQTYPHHCFNNDLIRVLVPYTGCSDLLTVVEGLPRAYQTCGLDKCFDVNDCGCKDCGSVTCEKLAPGTSHSYSISIYNNEGKEVGTVSGERARTLSGGLTESISARGDPRSSLFAIGMK